MAGRSLSALLLVTLALAACFSSAAAQQTVYPDTISYQAHGRDDIRQWRSDIIKGTTVWKVDFNFLPQVWCQNQPNVADPSDPRGCILLVHSQTAYNFGDRGPNSTTDVLNWLADPANKPLISMDKPRQYFAMTFRNFIINWGGRTPKSPCDNSTDSNNNIALFDDFFNAANKVIQDNNLNVEFYIDQIAASGNASCLADRWRPWVSSWDRGVLDNQAQSNTSSNGDDRFQVMNRGELTSQWQQFANNSFFKFGQSSYPLVLYEPIDEPRINFYQDIYLSSGLNHVPGFRIATNSDPAMFNLYSGSRSKKTVHVQITNDTAINVNSPANNRVLGYVNWPQTVTIPGSGSFTIVTIYIDNTQTYRYIAHSAQAPADVSNVAGPLPRVKMQNYTQIGRSALPSPPSGILTSAGQVNVNGNQLIWVSNNTAMLTYKLDASTGSLTFNSVTLFTANSTTDVQWGVVTAIPFPGASDGSLAVVKVTAGALDNNIRLLTPCTVWAQLYKVNPLAASNTSVAAASAVGSTQCISNWPGPSQGSGAKLAATIVPAYNGSRCNGGIEVFAAYSGYFSFNMISIDPKVYATHFCMDPAGGDSPAPLVPALTTYPPVFAIGDFPSVAALAYNGRAVLALVNTNSFCYNSYQRDDSPLGLPQICDAYKLGFGQPSLGVLAYTYGYADVLVPKLQANTPNGTLITSACDDMLLHGTYDQGYQPTIALAYPGGPAPVAVEVHVGIESLAHGDCGSPVPSSGLVLDSWVLPQLPTAAPASS
ncbi:hypothetical protein KFL_004870010 [Klebsormidium nitens]|uniref:Uncharacterized protein n=1 Tax=Klebsormidium nitens TaxID=105231 RepID=A0A1Y1IK19_KLENI|nr:hypothetical protein KFL_004870010 [Klebsormidium nitens]|eukprot:GAQ89096.1 hypothetical protein KFL_004870010 [Klebsormidium nitens]